MDENTREIMFSSKSDEYETPLWLFDMLDDIFHFTLDPAASYLSYMCENYYTIADDGLSQDWDNETWFINPPFSEAKKWVEMAAQGFMNGESEGVMLLPVRTDTKYWHESIWPVAHYALFVKGRLKFVNRVMPLIAGDRKPTSAPFPSVILMFTYREFDTETLKTLSEYGHVVDLWK